MSAYRRPCPPPPADPRPTRWQRIRASVVRWFLFDPDGLFELARLVRQARGDYRTLEGERRRLRLIAPVAGLISAAAMVAFLVGTGRVSETPDAPSSLSAATIAFAVVLLAMVPAIYRAIREARRDRDSRHR